MRKFLLVGFAVVVAVAAIVLMQLDSNPTPDDGGLKVLRQELGGHFVLANYVANFYSASTTAVPRIRVWIEQKDLYNLFEGGIQPDENYPVRVVVYKSASVKLPAGTWEVGAYFRYGDTSFNKGTWENVGGEWVYSGWYEDRVENISWEDSAAGERVFEITLHTVSDPRPEEDKQRGMIDLSTIIHPEIWVYIKIENVNHRIDNYQVIFEIGGNTFTAAYYSIYSNRTYWGGKHLSLIDNVPGNYIDVSTDAFMNESRWLPPLPPDPNGGTPTLPIYVLLAVGAFIAIISIVIVVTRRRR